MEVILIHIFAAVVSSAVVAIDRVLAWLLCLIIVFLLILTSKLFLYVSFPTFSVIVLLAGAWAVQFINILQIFFL